MEHEPSLLPNFTMGIQMGIFFLCWGVLHRLVFKPYVALIHLRHEKTVGLKEQAMTDRESATKLQEKYESLMKEERKKITAMVDAERQTVSEEERRIVQEARASVGEELKALRANVQTEYDRARRELVPQVREYSSHIASKLVGHKLNVPAASVDFSKGSSAESTVIG